jgi:hypothetical protein
MRFQHFIFILFVICCSIIADAGYAASPRLLLQSGDWKAYTLPNEEGKICYVIAKPLRTEGGGKARGVTYLFINFRPRLEIKDEVIIEAGYTFKKDSPVVVTASENKFSFVSDNTRAWQVGAGTDRALVKAMLRSKTVAVQSNSMQGARITETYSLRGFAETYAAAAKDCGNL